MKGKPKRSPREKDLTARYLSGNLDEDLAGVGRGPRDLLDTRLRQRAGFVKSERLH